MKYLMTGIDQQLDKGFGINAFAFNRAADQLYNSKEYNDSFNPQKHMPVFYLYRHTIELYFKSMIFLIHLELAIPYGKDSKKPQLHTEDGKWRDLDNCHWIDALYWYWAKLILDYSEKLNVVASKGDWRVHPDLKNMIDMIAKYDRDSTYFRYPFTKNNQKGQDEEKYSMKKVDDIQELINKTDSKKGSITLIIKDQDDNIKSIYAHEENVLSELMDVFKETAEILSGYHSMTRMTLSDGF
ncbi:hypothetical protein [Neobacillus sp. FSL H8-0543]|uniref:hypothetical protein n=1 Tax=Neobacillus sp. FSL H8-0543 TaxID=2954672 RepID=UPI0031583A0F